MAFTEKSKAGNSNGTTAADILAAPASGTRYVIRSLLIHNVDTGAHNVIVNYVQSSVTYELLKVYLAVGDTLVQDVPVILSSINSIQIRLAEVVVSAQCTFLVTYAEVTP